MVMEQEELYQRTLGHGVGANLMGQMLHDDLGAVTTADGGVTLTDFGAGTWCRSSWRAGMTWDRHGNLDLNVVLVSDRSPMWS